MGIPFRFLQVLLPKSKGFLSEKITTGVLPPPVAPNPSPRLVRPCTISPLNNQCTASFSIVPKISPEALFTD